MIRSTVTRRTAVGSLAVLALAACSQGGEEIAPTVEAPPEEPMTSDGGGEDTVSDGGGETSRGEATEVTIDETFTDEETGDQITIISAMRDVVSEEDTIYVEEGGEVVWLQFELTPGDQFGGAISPNDFYIVYDGEEDRAKGKFSEEITAAGETPLDTASRRDGPTGPLWVGFTVEGQRADTYQAFYLREEAKVLGEDTTIPEFRAEFEIPAA